MKKKIRKSRGVVLPTDDQDAIVDHAEDISRVEASSSSASGNDTLLETQNEISQKSVKFQVDSTDDDDQSAKLAKRKCFGRRKTSHFAESNSVQQEVGSCDLLSQKYESLDYDFCENTLYLEEQKKDGYKFIFQKNVLRWFVIFLIAILTALTACFIVVAVEELSDLKYSKLKTLMDDCFNNNCLYLPFGFWLIMNALPVMAGSIIVTYFAPVAAGSGIPLIKCYLNGVKVPEVVRVKTFLAKAFGVVCSVVGGLAVGKEGPMIHCGAVIAAGISQGKSTTFRKDFKVFESFREDREKRDFVSAGKM